MSSATIFPVVKKQHQLLVTLLLCNAVAMEVQITLLLFVLDMRFSVTREAKSDQICIVHFHFVSNVQALPLYLDKIFNQYVAIILSVTFVLFFGEVIILHLQSLILPVPCSFSYELFLIILSGHPSSNMH